MKTFLLSAGGAVLIATAALPASAGQFTMNDNGPSGPIIAVGDDRYYDNGYNGNWRYPPQGYGDQDGNHGYGNRGYGNGYGSGHGYGNGGYGYRYGNYGVVPPHVIVRRLHWNGFSYISRPVLSGQFYQIKARDPNGRKVKLWVDAYNGRIVRVKKK
jgi:hypothetical protein